jgi:hypothetical protein
MTYTSDTDLDPRQPYIDSGNEPSTNYGLLTYNPMQPIPRTFSGRAYELELFLEDFAQMCDYQKIESPSRRYKSLLRFCTPKVARTIKTWPSHKEKDFDELIQELNYFYGDNKARFNMG